MQAGTTRPISNMGDIAEIESIPLIDRKLPASTYEMLARGAAIASMQPALSFFLRAADYAQPHVWSHAALFADITRTANALRRLGIGRRDVVAFVLPNLPETHFVIWGGEAAGIAFAINPLLESGQIAELLEAGKAKWLITLGPTPGTDLWERAAKAAAAVTHLKGILTVDIGRYVRGARGLALRTLSRLRKPRAAGVTVPILDLHKEIARERSDSLTFEMPKGDDVSSYFCTGGTTGSPKIAVRSHFSEAFDCWATITMVSGTFRPGRTIFCGLPLFHVNGQLVTGLGPWSAGAHVVIGTPQGYRGEGVVSSFWKLIEHYRINVFSGVPTLYAALLNVPVGDHDISSVEYGICGAAPMPTELFRNFEATTKVKILEAYGLTEAACGSSANPPAGERRIGSIGLHIPYQKMAAVVVNDSGNFVRFAETDETGIIAINGPNVFNGYLEPEQNKRVWLNIDGERWLNTGDLGRQDRDGYFWLTGRKKELIIRGGHNIDPKLIEDALQTHPAVQLVAAIGRPDPHAGEVPVAYVQLKSGASADAVTLRDHAEQHIRERAARPKAVKILPALPVTPVGKIFKPALILLEIEDVVRSEAASAGVALQSLSVVQDAKRGPTAKMMATGDFTTLKTALARYTFQTEFL